MFLPVATTIPDPLPPVIVHPHHAMLVGYMRFSLETSASHFFGSDTPVRMPSSINSLSAVSIRISAGTFSPAPKEIISPGTRSTEDIYYIDESRTTWVLGIIKSLFANSVSWFFDLKAEYMGYTNISTHNIM